MKKLQMASLAVILTFFASSAYAFPIFAPPPPATAHLKPYSTWAALSWQWAVETPVDVNPVLDTTGAHCAANQQVPGVFFLATSFAPQAIIRSCTVPVGSALLIPILNSAYFAQQTDPPEQRTEAFVRAQVRDVDQSASLLLSVDGVHLANPLSYLEHSDLFSANLPPNNVFGIPPQLLSPSADKGYYGFLEPLAPGPHTIHMVFSWSGVSEDITYHLLVQGTVGTPRSCSGNQRLDLDHVDIQSADVALTASGNCSVRITNSVLWGATAGIVIHDQGHVIVEWSVVGGGTSFTADGHGHGEYRNSAILNSISTGPSAVVSDSEGNGRF